MKRSAKHFRRASQVRRSKEHGRVLLALLALICLIGGFFYFFGSEEGFENLDFSRLDLPSLDLNNLRVRSQVQREAQELMEKDLRLTEEIIREEHFDLGDMLESLDAQVDLYENAAGEASGGDAALYTVLVRYSKAHRELWSGYLQAVDKLERMNLTNPGNYKTPAKAHAIRREVFAAREANRQLAGFYRQLPYLMKVELDKAGVPEDLQDEFLSHFQENYEVAQPYFARIRELDDQGWQLVISLTGFIEIRVQERRTPGTLSEAMSRADAESASLEAYIDRLKAIEKEVKEVGMAWIKHRKTSNPSTP